MPAQYWQAPLHAVSQQTVSAQLLLRHCPPVLQVWPFLSLQVPVPSQVFVPLHPPLASSALTIAVQVPAPAVPAHVWQAAHDGDAQQTLSTQLALVHSAAEVHPPPLPCFSVQVPALQ
jgi:hypothetical protein